MLLPRPPGRRPTPATGHRPACRRPLVMASAVAVLTTGVLLPGTAPALAGPATAPAAPTIHTVRTASGEYSVEINGVRRALVKVSDRAFTVRTALSQDGAQAALITDFTGRTGNGLRVLDVAGGGTRTVATGQVSSAAFTPDGHLGYVSTGTLYVVAGGAGQASPQAVATVPGQDVALLGWNTTGTAAFVQHWTGGDRSAPSLSRVDLVSGTIRPVLTSDPANGVVYQDLRVVSVGGTVRVSAIRADHVYPCAGRSSRLILASEDGTVLRSLAATSDSYREAVWSADGSQVAYSLQGCVSVQDKMASRAAALTRLDAVNGVYVRDVSSGRTHRAVRGIPTNFRLDALTGAGTGTGARVGAGVGRGAVRFTSDRFGSRTVDAGQTDATTGPHLDAAASDIGIDAKIVGSTFIHQLWDTADNFNGNSACGPTSAVMDLAGYQLANQNGYWVSTPYSHWSGYGGYITNVYSAYGTTYNAYAPDPNWNYFPGAYGWLVDDPNVGTIHAYMRDYLDRHVSYAVAESSGLSWSWVKSKIDANLMVVVSGYFAYGRYGHIALITGYLDDGRFYVNDPYGAGTDGSFDGKNTVYTLDYMRVGYAWAA